VEAHPAKPPTTGPPGPTGQRGALSAVIVTGGDAVASDVVAAADISPDLVIAADSGLDVAVDLGLSPTVLVGDLDSVSERRLAAFRTASGTVIAHPTDKDDTDLALAIGPGLIGHRREAALERLGFVLRLELAREGAGERHGAAGDVDTVVRHLGPVPHERSCIGIGGSQGRLGERVVKIFADHPGIADDRAIMDQCRHNPVGIKRQILLRQMLIRGEVDQSTVPVEFFFGKAKPYLLAAGRMICVVKREHVSALVSYDR